MLIVVIFFAACESASTTTHTIKSFQTDSIKQGVVSADTLQADSDYANYFVLIADTGLSYDLLHDQMLSLSKALPLPIDTMGRFYNRKKQLIALPDDDDDEMYAGDYSPRRFPSVSLSLEYMQFYKPESQEKTIALVCGIYENDTSCDRALHQLQTFTKNAFKIKSLIYTGCMH